MKLAFFSVMATAAILCGTAQAEPLFRGLTFDDAVVGPVHRALSSNFQDCSFGDGCYADDDDSQDEDNGKGCNDCGDGWSCNKWSWGNKCCDKMKTCHDGKKCMKKGKNCCPKCDGREDKCYGKGCCDGGGGPDSGDCDAGPILKELKMSFEGAKIDYGPGPGNTDPLPDWKYPNFKFDFDVEEDIVADPDDVTYAFVVYAADKDGCDYSTVLGASEGAHIADMVTTQVNVIEDEAISKYHKVQFDFPTNNFDDPAVSYIEKSDHGYLAICVEYQQLVCGEKVMFGEVLAKVKFELKAECEACPLAKLYRGSLIGEVYKEQDFATIDCELCDYEDDKKFKQGEEIGVCLDYNQDGNEDFEPCFKEVKYMKATLYKDGNEIQTVDLLDLPDGTPAWYYGPSGETCVSGPFSTTDTGCYLYFIPGASLFQELNRDEYYTIKLKTCVISTLLEGECGPPGDRILQGGTDITTEIEESFYVGFEGKATETDNGGGGGGLFATIMNAILTFLSKLFGG